MDKKQTTQYASESPSLTDLLNIPKKEEQKKPTMGVAGVRGLAMGLAATKKPTTALKLKPAVEKRSATEAGLEARDAKSAKLAGSASIAAAAQSVKNEQKVEPVDEKVVSQPVTVTNTHIPAPTASVSVVKSKQNAQQGTKNESKQHSHQVAKVEPSKQKSLAAQQRAKTSHLPANPAVIRQGGGKVWEDKSMLDWDPSHFLLFVGNLGPEVSEQLLHQTFSNPYPSVSRVRIVKDKKSDKSKGYGFVAFADGKEFLRALKEMQGRWIGNRQCQIKKSDFNKKF